MAPQNQLQSTSLITQLAGLSDQQIIAYQAALINTYRRDLTEANEDNYTLQTNNYTLQTEINKLKTEKYELQSNIDQLINSRK